MRRQRRGARALVLVLVFGFVKALEADTLTGDGSIDTFKLADAFENVSEENVTELLDEIVVPASLESEAAVPPVEEEPRDLRPLEDSTANRHARSLTTAAPYGGALVAVQATALLVGGAAVVVLFIAKIKRRYSADQCGYDEDLSDPMLQSLLYSDMDYAAI